MFLFSHLTHLPKTVSMSVVLQEVWLSLSPPPRVFSGISLRPREALRGNYLGRISCTYSYTEMIFGTIFKYSKTNYMQNKWQHFIKKHKSYVMLAVSGLSFEGGQKGAKHYLSKQCDCKYLEANHMILMAFSVSCGMQACCLSNATACDLCLSSSWSSLLAPDQTLCSTNSLFLAPNQNLP